MARVKRRILAKRYAPIELISVAVSRVAVELRTRVESCSTTPEKGLYRRCRKRRAVYYERSWR
ncbi:hypothetical protein AB2I81_11880 [Escherichia coli]